MHFSGGGGGRGDDDDTVTLSAKFSRRAGLLGIYSTFVMSDHLIYSPNLLLNFEEEQRATHGRPVWAVKKRSWRCSRRGPRSSDEPPATRFSLELVVLDLGHAVGWSKLIKVWASLRWSDLASILAGLALVEGRLVTTLRRTKTSGPNRREGAAGRYFGTRLHLPKRLAKGRLRPAEGPR